MKRYPVALQVSRRLAASWKHGFARTILFGCLLAGDADWVEVPLHAATKTWTPQLLSFVWSGPEPGANGYDQLNVNGSVNLSGIALNVAANFPAATNQEFVLIANDFADAVEGTFTGLPQNASLTAGGQIFRISYTGGDGNDVVLAKIADAFRPTLTIERAPPGSVRLLWPTNDPAFSLHFATNLPATHWSPASPPPVIVGANNVVTNAASDAHRFYRLRKP